MSTTNAFTINRVGLGGAFFPFSLSMATTGDGTVIRLWPQRILDICDLIEDEASENLVVFGVSQASSLDPVTDEPMALTDLAAAVGLPHIAIDSRTIILESRSLAALLETFSHYELSCFDVRAGWREDAIIAAVLAFREASEPPALATLPGSRLFLMSHDDCYVTAVAANAAWAADLFGRTLQGYALALWPQRCGRDNDVVAPPRALFDSVRAGRPAVTILEQHTLASDHGLRIGVSRVAFSFKEDRAYAVDCWIDYDAATGRWSVAASPDVSPQGGTR